MNEFSFRQIVLQEFCRVFYCFLVCDTGGPYILVLEFKVTNSHIQDKDKITR